MRERIEGLDWLRGLMAISIMVYHLTVWVYFPLDSTSLLGRLGVYGVSIFFILSGLSMAIVYANYFVDGRRAGSFIIRRIFRIWPLLWLCVFLQSMLVMAAGRDISLVKVAANLTTLFGFIKPDFYINTGAWSIGNEMVYYAMTPFLIGIYAANRSHGNFLLLMALAISIYFSFFILTPESSLVLQWKTYINPFNNFFLYVSGIAIYFNLKDVKFSLSMAALMFSVSSAFFLFYPTTGGLVSTVTGVNRIIFMAASIALVVSFYKFPFGGGVPQMLRVPLEKFGVATYGVYLLHPIVFACLVGPLRVYSGPSLSPGMIFMVVIVLTISGALLSYKFFEQKMIAIGRRVTLGLHR